MKYIESKYNFFLRSALGSGYLGFNSFTCTLLQISNNDYIIIKKILNQNVSINRDSKTEEQKKLLYENGFIIKRRHSQYAKLQRLRNISKKSKNTFSLTIAPTLACNLRCIYCFEEHPNINMSLDTQDALFDFVKKNIKKNGNFRVTWYGGEPLIQFKTIISLTDRFVSICKEKNVKYSASIITNGLLLDGRVAKQLSTMNIGYTQVTLDGLYEEHDKRRPDISGNGTFSRIINNLMEAQKYLPITFRINVDKTNLNSYKDLYKWLNKKGFLRNNFVYLGRIVSPTAICNDIAENCIELYDFSKMILQFSMTKSLIDNYNTPYPLRKNIACIADNKYGWVVSPSGYLYKCWNEVSDKPENAVGTLFGKPSSKMLQNLKRYEEWSPFEFSECKDCKLLPICMGGCPYDSLNIFNGKKGSCIYLKKHLEEFLQIYHVKHTSMKVKEISIKEKNQE